MINVIYIFLEKNKKQILISQPKILLHKIVFQTICNLIKRNISYLLEISNKNNVLYFKNGRIYKIEQI